MAYTLSRFFEKQSLAATTLTSAQDLAAASATDSATDDTVPADLLRQLVIGPVFSGDLYSDRDPLTVKAFDKLAHTDPVDSAKQKYDDGGVVFQGRPYDPGFVVYIDAEGNIVCGYPPVAPEGPWSGPTPAPVEPEGPWTGPYPLPGTGVVLQDPGFVVYIDENGNAVCGYPPSVSPHSPSVPEPAESLLPQIYDEGGVVFTPAAGDGTVGVTLYDPGFTVYIDAEGNVVCGMPGSGDDIRFQGLPTVPVNVKEVYTFPIDLPVDGGAQEAIDSFVIATSTRSKVATTEPVTTVTDESIRINTDMPHYYSLVSSPVDHDNLVTATAT